MATFSICYAVGCWYCAFVAWRILAYLPFALVPDFVQVAHKSMRCATSIVKCQALAVSSFCSLVAEVNVCARIGQPVLPAAWLL